MKLQWDIKLQCKGDIKRPSDRLIATCYMYGAALQIAENMRNQLQCYEPYIEERRSDHE